MVPNCRTLQHRRPAVKWMSPTALKLQIESSNNYLPFSRISYENRETSDLRFPLTDLTKLLYLKKKKKNTQKRWKMKIKRRASQPKPLSIHRSVDRVSMRFRSARRAVRRPRPGFLEPINSRHISSVHGGGNFSFSSSVKGWLFLGLAQAEPRLPSPGAGR